MACQRLNYRRSLDDSPPPPVTYEVAVWNRSDFCPPDDGGPDLAGHPVTMRFLQDDTVLDGSTLPGGLAWSYVPLDEVVTISVDVFDLYRNSSWERMWSAEMVLQSEPGGLPPPRVTYNGVAAYRHERFTWTSCPLD